MLEEAKDMAMEQFAANLSGRKNVGKFMHTSQLWNEVANDFEGWKVTTIDKKIKDYIEAQVAICKKAEAAATSGFGLDPALSNLILDTKLGSGSENFTASKSTTPRKRRCLIWCFASRLTSSSRQTIRIKTSVSAFIGR